MRHLPCITSFVSIARHTLLTLQPCDPCFCRSLTHLLLVLGVCASLGIAQGAIMAVDLGSEWLKVSVVKPGRSPFSIVVNEMCARHAPYSDQSSLLNPLPVVVV